MTTFLSAAEVYTINEKIVGHRPIVRDRHLLRSAVLRPMQQAFGQEAYPTLAEKTAALLHALAHDHLFSDGNKRTASEAALRFLGLNGMMATWNHDELQAFVLEIAQGHHDVQSVALWLGPHIQAISSE